jgi:TM2 domain-containing membrane protein YozV
VNTPPGPPVFYKNPAVAVVLSFFWAGLGQLYNGQIAKGIIFIIVHAVCVLSCYIIIGYVTPPIIWIIGMVDAYLSATKVNERLHQQSGYHGGA